MFRNLAIKWKLATLVGIMLVGLAAIGLSGYVGIRQLNAAMDEIGHVSFPSVQSLLIVSEGQTAVKAANLSTAIYENDYNAQKQFALVQERRQKAWTNIESGWKKYEPLPQSAEEAALWKQFVGEWDAWKRADAEIAATIEALSTNDNAEKQKELFVEFYKRYMASVSLFSKAEDALNKVVVVNQTAAAQSVKAGDDAMSRSEVTILVVALITLLISIPCAVYITVTITGPVNQAVKVAQIVATGDLTSHIEVRTKDETGQLLQALKDMNDSLVKIVGEVRIGSDTIATASSQIASGNLDLSSRTEEQASSLEETASSMEELTSTVQQNAGNARQANGLALAASEVAVNGGAVVSQVVDTMGAINESSKKIVDIISVIDGIAFQTNILALNAAVEAARAGEQGRGFAVVASEVRNLAQRSAAAAKEIKTLIGDSVEKVDNGSKLVKQAGATMQEIVASITRVTDIMGEITAATQEQTSGIEQINQAITQMDQVTQQNASLVEEAAAASEAMQEQAGKLAQVVSVFKLDGRQATTTTPVARQHSLASRKAGNAPELGSGLQANRNVRLQT